MSLTFFGIGAVLFVVIIYNTVKILKEYERGVIFLLGRFQTVKGMDSLGCRNASCW